MKANVFRSVNQFGIEEVPRPRPGAGEAVIGVTLTTFCGTDRTPCGQCNSCLSGYLSQCGPDQIQEAYAVFGDRRDGVSKVAIRPS